MCMFTLCVGDLDKALEHFTAAVLSNSNSAPQEGKVIQVWMNCVVLMV